MENLSDMIKRLMWKPSSPCQEQLVDNLRRYDIRWYELNKKLDSETKFPNVLDKHPELTYYMMNQIVILEKSQLDTKSRKEEIISQAYDYCTKLNAE